MARKLSTADILRLAVGILLVPIVLGVSCPNQQVITGACCVGGNTCNTGMTQAECTNAGGVFEGAGSTTCANCPPAAATDLINGTFTSNNGTAIIITQSPCYVAPALAHNFLQQTFNAVAGKLVTLTVTGPTATSRPRILVTDLFANVVANSGGTPTAQSVSTTFTPVGSQLFIMTMEDCEPSAAGNYQVHVTQAP